MVESLGKKFEHQLSNQFIKQEICFDRLKDDMSGLKGSSNIADFIVFYDKNLFYLECKTVHGNLFNYRLLRDNQYEGLLNKCKYDNTYPGVLLWFVDHDITVFIPITHIKQMKLQGEKSFKYYDIPPVCTVFHGVKKRVFFDYDLKKSLNQVVLGRNKYGY